MAFPVACAVAGFFTACDKTPTGPTSGPPRVVAADPNPPPPTPAPPVEPGVRSVEMVGPQVVPLGETAQFSLIARLTDGSTRDVTNEALWSQWLEAVSIVAPGLVTGRARGPAMIEAVFGTHHGSKHVSVLPAGTYKLEGRVSESGVPAGPVVGARVEVTTGVGAGLAAYTDGFGQYAFYGVSGQTGLRVTKDGYQPVLATAPVANHHRYDFELQLLRPRADVSGTYTLTIAAADHCGVGLGEGYLPEEARVRAYTAAVRQDGPVLNVTLTGATFFSVFVGVSPNVDVVGRVQPREVVLYFPWGDGNEPPYVLEQLPTSRYLLVSGDVVAAGAANRFAGTLSGQMSIHETRGIFDAPIAWCHSTSHQFVLSR